MKTSLKNLFIATSLLGVVASVQGQGSIQIDNSTSSNRVSIDIPANPYTGTFSMEVWEANNANPSLSAVLDITAATNSLAAYALLAANEFQLEGAFVNRTMLQGVFTTPGLAMRDVQPAGGTVTLALVIWNTGAATWDAAVAAGAKGGLIAFIQPTADYTLVPPPVGDSLDWTIPQDLVMMSTVPEPGAIPLAVMGVVVLMGWAAARKK